MAKSPAEIEAAMIADFRSKTGKMLEQWLAIAKKSGAEKHGALMKVLKSDHGMTHGFANFVALKYLKSDAGSLQEDGADLVALQYAGDKAALKPLYEKLFKMISGFGGDIEFAPKKAYVSIRRAKQFAIIQPSTKTRLDLGVNLKGTPATGRLEPSGGFNAMVSHRVRIEKASDIDSEVKKWLQKAYEQS